jgi:tagatose-1,6-bisphosphate aldolase
MTSQTVSDDRYCRAVGAQAVASIRQAVALKALAAGAITPLKVTNVQVITLRHNIAQQLSTLHEHTHTLIALCCTRDYAAEH